MNKQNLLSRAEMKKVMGGTTTPEIFDEGRESTHGCNNKSVGDSCTSSSVPGSGTCKYDSLVPGIIVCVFN